MKKLSILFILLLSVIIHQKAISAGCETSTGNVLQLNVLSSTATVNIAVGADCRMIIPNISFMWRAYPTKLFWRFESFSQDLAPGTIISPPGSACITGTRVTIRITAHFRDTRGTRNTGDDRFCTITKPTIVVFEDRTPPIANNFTISSSDGELPYAFDWKMQFTSAHISDNCSSLVQLRNNLAFNFEGPPSHEDGCVEDTITLGWYFTSDMCGNRSRRGRILFTVTDTVKPRISVVGPSEIPIGTLCRAIITPEMITSTAIDNLVDDRFIIKKFRVIAPVELAGNIPPEGLLLPRIGNCPANTTITVRVCAQDCYGNGNLHMSDNLMDVNCDTVLIALVDKSPPVLSPTVCGEEITLSVDAGCKAIMLNTVPTTFFFSDNCSRDASIYQSPAPGSVLNDGIADTMGLAFGSPWAFACPRISVPDDAINCINATGTFKSIDVSYIVVDCDGNCTVYEKCKKINLSKPSTVISAELENRSSTNIDGRLKASNYPNPFKELTQIKIEGIKEGPGQISFYNFQGQLMHRKAVLFNSNNQTITVTRHELNTRGLVYYKVEVYNSFSGNKSNFITGKMLITD